jgi:hypothetical protein
MYELIIPKELQVEKDHQPKCVIKITVGKKYLITRSLNIEFIKNEIASCYKKYKYRQGVWETNYYYPIVKHIVSKDIQTVSISIIFQSESGYEVLKEELRQLEHSFGKRSCLNLNDIPHIPSFKTKATPNKWLTHNEYLNFKRLLKSKQQ